jgi:hypothetical protein
MHLPQRALLKGFGLLVLGLGACADVGEEQLPLAVRLRDFPIGVVITDSFQDGTIVISGTPDVWGVTETFDPTPFDSVAVSFRVTFSVFPPFDEEEPYSIFVRRNEPPNDLIYSTTASAGESEHTIVLGLSDANATSFYIGANSHAPVNAVTVTISSLLVYGWSN